MPCPYGLSRKYNIANVGWVEERNPPNSADWVCVGLRSPCSQTQPTMLSKIPSLPRAVSLSNGPMGEKGGMRVLQFNRL